MPFTTTVFGFLLLGWSDILNNTRFIPNDSLLQFGVANFNFNFCCDSFVKHTFRAMYLLGMVESTQGIILLDEMWRHVTFGNVYWEFDCVHT